MSDTFGLPQFPLQPPTQGQAVADPALTILLSYLKAFLCDDQMATGAWQVAGVSPGNPPVVGTFPFDPEEDLFNSRDLPALYLWRDSASNEWLAEDYLIESSTLKLLWVFPSGTPENQAVRTPFVNGLVKAIQIAIERNRTPSWKQPNDTDPDTSRYGSALGNYLGAWLLRVDRWRRTHVVERGIDSSTRGVYTAVEVQLTLQEPWTVDITDPARFDPTSGANGVDQTVPVNPNASGVSAFVPEGYLAGTPRTLVGGPPVQPPTPGGVMHGTLPVVPAYWAKSTAYAFRTEIQPVLQSSTGLYYVATTGGTSGALPPTWPTSIGSTVVDGSVTWTCWGPLL